MRELLNIEENERVLFKRHFLKGVVIDFRFDNLSKEEILTEENKLYFEEQFKVLGYQDIEEMRNISFNISLTEDTFNEKEEGSEIGVVYTDKQSGNKIEIINNKLTIVENKYDCFDSFLTKICRILELFQSKFSNINVEKLGFRKINNIIITNIDSYDVISELFNENIFGSLNSKILEFGNMKKYTNSFEVEKDGYNCIINASCSKLNSERFDKSNAHEINIDLDFANSNLIAAEDIIAAVKDVNQLHYDLFLWVVSDKLKKVMNKED